MTDGEKKRLAIFQTYAKNLNIVWENGALKKEVEGDEFYACPICLNMFSNPEDEENPLTLEDAPPKSLGGTADVLTCKSCNNTCGHKIDFHLTERLRELDSRQFLPGTETKVKVKVGNEVLQGLLKVKEDGEMEIFHSKKNNHPQKLADEMQKLEGGEIVTMSFLKSRVIPENLEYALLKTAYLLAFKKFGYSLMIHPCYDIVRKQLLHPEERIYPQSFWMKVPYPKELCGVYFITEEGMEGLLSIFELKTEHSEKMFAVILPLPVQGVENIIAKINELPEGEFTLSLYPNPYESSKDDYLLDVKSIDLMWEWINSKKS